MGKEIFFCISYQDIYWKFLMPDDHNYVFLFFKIFLIYKIESKTAARRSAEYDFRPMAIGTKV
jgi:hypothetical protein